MNVRPWAAGRHERHVDDGRVVIARVLSRAEDGGQRQEAAVGHFFAARVTAIDDPIQQGTDVWIEFEQENDRLLGQSVDFFIFRCEQNIEPRVDVTVAVLRQSLTVETRAAAQHRAHRFDGSQFKLGRLLFLGGARRVETERTTEFPAPSSEQYEQLLPQISFQETRAYFHWIQD